MTSTAALQKLLSICVVVGVAACGSDGDGLPSGGEPAPDASVASPDSGVRPRPDAGPGPTLPPPTLNSLTPGSGPETGGTRVLLRGSSFREPAEVFFADRPATSVVVLDEVSVAATAPEGTVGGADVRIVTADGEAVLPNGFTYITELRLDAIEPARVPDEGGVQVTLRGRGFDERTLVLFDRDPLRGQQLLSSTEITGYVPGLPPGRPEIRVVNAVAEVRRSDLLVVFATPDIDAVAPGYGPLEGGEPQSVAGEGFDGASAVTIADEPADTFDVSDDARVDFVAPMLTEGPHDVVVANPDASGTLTGGYIAVDVTNPELAVLGVTPNRVSTEGGTFITIVGRGFSDDLQVSISGLRVPVASLDGLSAVIEVPRGLTTGPQTVELFTGGQSITATAAFSLFRPVEITNLSPREGPVEGGTRVTINGIGFVEGTEVRIADVPLTDVVVVSDREITATTVAGASGEYDVIVRTPDTEAVLANGFRFTAPFEVIRVEPAEGSIAGNTYVTVLGRGFVGPVDVAFGGVDGFDARVENGSVIGVRTAPARAGPVDVSVVQRTDTATLSEAYRFFNPRLLTGGAWGGPIEGAVNVAVADFNGQPLPDMVVQLGLDADPRYRAVTDQNGLATISSPEIRGPQTITAGQTDIEFVTFTDLPSENLTILASSHPQSMQPEDPRPPCGQPPEFGQVRGRIFKLKSTLDLERDPDVVPVVRITYTESNVFSPNPPDPMGLNPSQFDFVSEEGGEYHISVLRNGSVAIYAILGDLNPTTQQFTPRKMGFARSVPIAPGVVTEGIDISLEFDMNASTRIRLDDPPEQNPGPSLNAIFPFLNLESDGVVPFDPTIVTGSGVIQVDNLPNVSESAFFYLGGSFTFNQTTGGLANPYSLTLVDSAQPFAEGVDLGPFLEMPTNVIPKAGELVQGGSITWTQGGAIPDVATLSVVDVRGVFGCCCDDLNMNGQCEAGEPERCGALPQQFNRWSVFGPGNLQSKVLPRMPGDVQAFEPPRTYNYFLQLAVAPRFDYREFVYNQFNPFFWQSWVAYTSTALFKEETD